MVDSKGKGKMRGGGFLRMMIRMVREGEMGEREGIKEEREGG